MSSWPVSSILDASTPQATMPLDFKSALCWHDDCDISVDICVVLWYYFKPADLLKRSQAIDYLKGEPFHAATPYRH